MYELQLIDMVNSVERAMLAKPLTLGGLSSSGGGYGGPPGGFVGWLPQSRVAYDYTEATTLDTPGSGLSLLDNLNHIRALIGSGGGGVSYFTSLLDVPDSYTGNAGKLLVVDAAEDGLEYSSFTPYRFLITDVNGNPFDLDWITFNQGQKQVIIGRDSVPINGGTAFHMYDTFGHTGGEAFFWAYGLGTADMPQNEFSGRVFGVRSRGTVENPSGILKDDVILDIAGVGMGDNGDWFTTAERAAATPGDGVPYIEHSLKLFIRFAADSDFGEDYRATRMEVWTTPVASGITQAQKSFVIDGEGVDVVSSGWYHRNGSTAINDMWTADAASLTLDTNTDEFNDNTIAGSWTQLIPGTTTLVFSEEDNGFIMSQNQDDISSDIIYGVIYKDVPAGDFSVTTKISSKADMSGGLIGGILLSDGLSTDYTTADAKHFGWYFGGAGTGVQIREYVGITNAPTATTRNDVWDRQYSGYIRLRYDSSGNNVYVDISDDGNAWKYLCNESLSFTPTEMGLALHSQMNSTQHGSTAFQFFRVTDSIDLSQRVNGRRI